ncbi:MAG: response regulator [Planctomycetaceae bacterium]|jgi:PleD family two-component response regulator|nr:response regulator [Planctomycetaceae bacterium]
MSDFNFSLATILPPSPRAFIVDDSVPTRRIFRNILEEIGLEVEEAVNGQQALEQLQENGNKYCIIFSDISMPKMDGFELCYRLQQESWYKGTPFVLVSTESDATNVIKGLKLGADDFMPKPFDREMAEIVIARVMAYKNNQQNKNFAATAN